MREEGERKRYLDVPLAGAQGVQTQLVGDLSDGLGVGEILLVGEDKEDRVTELILPQHLLELKGGLINTLTVIRVDNVNNSLGVLVVVAPQRPDLVLSTNIPSRG